MKTARELIKICNGILEAKTVTSLRVGDNLDLPSAKISITEIWIEDVHFEPNTWVKYKYTTTADGRSGVEKNSIGNFKKNLLEGFCRSSVKTCEGIHDGLEDTMKQAWTSSPEYKQAQAVEGQIEGLKAKEQGLRDQIKKLSAQIVDLEKKKMELHQSFILRHKR